MPTRKLTTVPVLGALSPEEVQDPLLALENIFDQANLDQSKELLWAWLKTTVAGNYNTALDTNERALVLSTYENMEKLLEAAFLLQEQHKAASIIPV